MMRPDTSPQPVGRSPFLTAGLSLLLPGLGQAYAGQWRRGLVLMLGLPAQAALFFGVGLGWYAIWLGAVWLWNVWDAWLAGGTSDTPGPVRVAGVTLPVTVVLLVNFIAAWHVTDVQVPRLEKEQRSVIRRIAGGLLSPDFAERRTREVSAAAKYLVPGPGAPASIMQPERKADQPQLDISPVKVREGDTITVTGAGFFPNENGRLVLLGADEITVREFRTDGRGRFRAVFANPRSIPGDYFVEARMRVPVGGWEFSETLREAAPLMLETIYLALLGTVFSLVFAIPLSFFGARNLMSASPPLKLLYAFTRGLFTILRSVEVLIIAVIAVAAVGIGPFAGVLALAIHGVGALGKLYSEAIESIEHGPIEAIRSTGANEFQVVLFAVIPQVAPQFIAFTLYRWDINVRMATVIGLVGGGGIGYQLIQYMNLLQWQQAATAIWLIAAVVMLMDYASAVIREKVV